MVTVMIARLLDMTMTIIGFVIVIAIVLIILSNGAYYGDKAGDLIRGLIDLVTTFVTSATK